MCSFLKKVVLHKIFFQSRWSVLRGVARNFLEGGSKSSKMLATMVDRRIKFWVVEWL